MNSLALLCVYGSDDSEDEVPIEIDPAGVSEEPLRDVRHLPRNELVVDRCSDNEDSDTAPNIEACDSDGSFFQSGGSRKCKITKKDAKKEDSVNKRRAAHGVLLEDCECCRKCADLLTRDDKIQVHDAYWNLDAAGQKAFIRNYVHLAAVENRRKNRNASKDLRKKQSYTFSIPTASDVSGLVCRKFFLNTIGLSEHYG